MSNIDSGRFRLYVGIINAVISIVTLGILVAVTIL